MVLTTIGVVISVNGDASGLRCASQELRYVVEASDRGVAAIGLTVPLSDHLICCRVPACERTLERSHMHCAHVWLVLCVRGVNFGEVLKLDSGDLISSENSGELDELLVVS